MIVTQPRIVVVDNDANHLTAILEAFQRLGMPCLGIPYHPETGIGGKKLQGVRALFMDLHLDEHGIPTGSGEDAARHYAVIAGLLQEGISPTGGPFVLTIWTQYPEQVDGLKEYLDETLTSQEAYAMPLAVVGLPKREFIDIDSGQVLEGKAAALLEKVRETIIGNSQLAALFSWEADVQAAAGAVLATLTELVPAEMRKGVSYPEGLDEVLSGLARAAVGKDRVDGDPHGAISYVLAPILADRILNHENTPESRELWNRAITRHRNGGDIPSTPENSGWVNRMLHAAVPPAEKVGPTDWGAVVEFPAEWRNDEQLRGRFGLTAPQLFGGEFRLNREDRNLDRLRLVRIGAACDYAQNRPGPLPYLLGVEIPCDVTLKTDKDGKPLRASASEWTSPALRIDREPFRLAVNVRYSLSAAAETASTWTPLYRLREQLLMHLISHASGYLSRPGIIEMG